MLNKLRRIKQIIFEKNKKKFFDEHVSKAENSFLLDGFNIELRYPISHKIYIKIGENSLVNSKFLFETGEGEVLIGNNCFLGYSNIICRSKVEFGNNIFLAWGSTFYDHDSHSLDYKERQKDMIRHLEDHKLKRKDLSYSKDWSVVNSKPIKVCDNAWIGMNVLVLKGVTIGEGAVVGAGSVVTKDVPPYTVVGGNPARVLKKLN